MPKADAVLARLDKCRALLAQCSSVDDARQIAAVADAARVYGKRVGASRETVNKAIEYRIRAERRLGEILKAAPKAKGGQPHQKKSTGNQRVPVEPTLTEHGITKKESARAQKLASLSETEFERRVEAAAADGQELSIRRVVKPHGAHVGQAGGENEWYTPQEYIESARVVMGGIDLDPATHRDAQKTIKAKKFYTEKDDGLSKSWHGKVWLNPPYSQPTIKTFCQKVVDEYLGGNTSQAVVLVNNATETEWFQTLLSVTTAICFPKGRIRFWAPGRESATPLQGQAIIYIGRKHLEFVGEFFVFGTAFKVGE